MTRKTDRFARFVRAVGLATALCLYMLGGVVFSQDGAKDAAVELQGEQLAGEGVWVSPALGNQARRARRLNVKVWFDRQFLGDGKAYSRRAKEFADSKRTMLRDQVVATLKKLSDDSYAAAKDALEPLEEKGAISNVQRHWIVNGFSCTTTLEELEALKGVPGVKKIFVSREIAMGSPAAVGGGQKPIEESPRQVFDPGRYKHPWYIRALQADRVWQEFGVAGKGAMNVVHDFNFVYSPNIAHNAFRNPKEVPGNGKDDDQNGLVDDVHGYNFQMQSNRLTLRNPAGFNPQAMHGAMCATIICGAGTKDSPYEFGIAPESRWAGLIARANIESAVEWAVEQKADTYSMSFSIPGLGEMRSHWRKIMEHGSFCGVFFVSGAGNFAQSQPIPVQMRVPEDIPDVVFAAAGVQRDFSPTPFSSRGPVEWKTEHYQDGRVQKPEVCAFNFGLPAQLPNGEIRDGGLNGNSFAGPMFCGSIALMLSADPELLPWDLKEIITSTAVDVANPGVDYATGYGLINCYAAVKEVLRRKAIREGRDPAPYVRDKENDELDLAALKKRVGEAKLTVAAVQPGSPAADVGVKVGDVILTINDAPITTAAQFRGARAKTPEKAVTLQLKRGDKTVEVEMEPGRFGLSLGIAYDEPVFR